MADTPVIKNIGFIGGGAMAFAIASGLVSKGVIQPSRLGASGPHIENLHRWKKMGAYITTDNNEVFSKYDIIFICVKPKILEPCLLELQKTYKVLPEENKIFISVLAGVTIETLENVLSFINRPKVIRTMPNTSVQVGEGCVIYSPGRYVTSIEKEKVKVILQPLGLTEEVPEYLIDPITGVSGCGPAFVYTIIEGLADGALKQGVPKQMALRIAAQTLLGASKTVLSTEMHPAVLRDQVCSPGGSTICGVYELEKGNIRATLMNAVEKSVEKSKMLGNLK